MIGDHKKIVHRPEGTTLLEVIVALGLFLLVITAMLGVFANSLQVERRASATQAALDDARYTLEIMSRAIRQANPTDALDTSASTCGVAGTCLSFTHESATKGVVTYRLTNNAITEQSNTTSGSPVSITGSNVQVQRLTFYVDPTASGLNDGKQPWVTIVARVSSPLNPNVVADIQTSVDIRALQE